MSRAKELREQRAKIVFDAQELLKKPVITPEDRANFDKAMKDADVLKGDIDRIEAAEVTAEEIRKATAPPADGKPGAAGADPTQEQRTVAYRKAFKDYLINGEEPRAYQRGMSVESRKMLLERRDTDSSGQAAGANTISYSAGAAGGYFVPAGFVYDVDVATKFYFPFMDGKVIRILETATGNVLPYPTANDTSNVAAVLAENTQETENPLTMGVITFGAYKYSSRVVRVSLELIQDSAFDIEAFLKDQFAIRFGRGYEAAFTTGAGGGTAPTGIITAVVASGVTPITAAGAEVNSGNAGDTGANSIGTPDLVDLEHSVDPTYRRGASFMLHDDTLRHIKNLLDKFGRPIWLPGLAVNAPDTILGYPYVVNQGVAKIAASAKTVLFGNLQKFIVRKVREMAVLRLTERYADYGQLGFIAFSRVDSNLVDAGTHPINYLKQSS